MKLLIVKEHSSPPTRAALIGEAVQGPRFCQVIMRILTSPLFDQVQKQAQLLTLQEKAALAHLLIEELDSAAEADVEQLWIAESRRRYEAYLRGKLQSVPGDEAMASARQRIK